MSRQEFETLDERIIETTSANLCHLIERLSTTRERFADRLDYPIDIINDYCDGKAIPDYKFLLALKDKFEISIDEFLTRTDSPEDIYFEKMREQSGINTSSDEFRGQFESESPEELSRLCGNFFCYYLDTENYKGKDMNPADAAMNYGVLSIMETGTVTGKPTYDCVAMLGKKDRELIRKIKKNLDGCKSIDEIISCLTDEHLSKYIYYGKIRTSSDHYYLSLAHENEDKIAIILHRPNSRKPKYIGGIGTVNSVSRGRQHMPTVQFVGFSRYALNMSEEDIYHTMLLNYPNYHATQETEEMIRTFKNLYMNDENTGFSFTESQRQILIQSNIERIIKESLTRNLMRYAKVSEVDDDDWYHIIKYYGIKTEE
ncbi:MAG: hypothetical protein J6N47_07245 [Lachnospiraceae bacterium]|nr:hypothetical protein [Lachnospiraceae bacterium]